MQINVALLNRHHVRGVLNDSKLMVGESGLETETNQTFFGPPVPSFDLIAWMPRVDRLAVHVACIAVLNIDRVAAFAFDALLCLVVMECTQGLQLTMPKQIVVSFVRNDVICNRSNSNDTLGSAHNTERVEL